MAATLSPFKPVCTLRLRPRRSPTRIASLRSTSSSSPSSSQSQPSISEIERSIGIASDPTNSSSDANTSLLDFLESTPLAQETPVEKALRQAAQKFTDRAEAHTPAVHRFFLELFVKILPIWLLAVAVASGFIKLPFNVPFLDDLIM